MNGWMNVTLGVLGMTILGMSTYAGSEVLPSQHEAETTADAVVVMTAIRQTGEATLMAKMVDGGVGKGIPAVKRMVDSGWLKAVPKNPTNDNPSGYAVPRPLGDQTVVGMHLVSNGRDICDEVSKQLSGVWPAPVSDVPVEKEGCVMSSSGPMAYVTI